MSYDIKTQNEYTQDNKLNLDRCLYLYKLVLIYK